MRIGDIVYEVTDSKKVGIVTGNTVIPGVMQFIGYEVEWHDGSKSVETAFNIKRVIQAL